MLQALHSKFSQRNILFFKFEIKTKLLSVPIFVKVRATKKKKFLQHKIYWICLYIIKQYHYIQVRTFTHNNNAINYNNNHQYYLLCLLAAAPSLTVTSFPFQFYFLISFLFQYFLALLY